MSDAKPRGGAESLFIVDANNLVFRAYHGLPPLTSPDGTPVNAVHGYVRMILALRREFAPESFVAVFDAKGPSFRREIYEAYKANRPPAPEDLIPQLPLVREATAALSIPWTEEVGFEADDLVASYAIAGRDAGHHVTIVSSDKDLMQLVDPEDHKVLVQIRVTSLGNQTNVDMKTHYYGVYRDRFDNNLFDQNCVASGALEQAVFAVVTPSPTA